MSPALTGDILLAVLGYLVYLGCKWTVKQRRKARRKARKAKRLVPSTIRCEYDRCHRLARRRQ